MAGEDNSDAVPTGHAEDYVHFTFSPCRAVLCCDGPDDVCSCRSGKGEKETEGEEGEAADVRCASLRCRSAY